MRPQLDLHALTARQDEPPLDSDKGAGTVLLDLIANPFAASVSCAQS